MPDETTSSALSDTVSITGTGEALTALAAQAEQNNVTTAEGIDFSAPSPIETPSPVAQLSQPATRRVWDADTANARAASRPVAAFPVPASQVTFSATPGAPFDQDAYEAARYTGYFPSASAGIAPAPQVASPLPSPRFGTAAYSSYDEAAQAKSDILADARNLYAARGDFGSIGTPYFNAEVQEAYQSAGLAAPLEKPGPYQEARAKAADLTQDLNDTYASQNRFADIGGQDYRRDLRSVLHSAGLAPAPEEEADARFASPHQAAVKQRAGIEAMVRDDYTLRGDFDEIGTPTFQKDVRGELVEAGLAEEKPHGLRGALANMKEDFADPSGYGKLNYGYAVQQIGQEGSQFYEKTNSGNYLTPEQRETATAGFLPGLGAIAGTAIGSALAPGVGSWVGGMVGGGVGAAAQGIIGANEERSQATREAAEKLAASLGAAADSVGSFRGALESTGAPIQSLSQGLSALQSTGPGVGINAVAGAGRSALAEGEYYAADTASTAKFLSASPALAPLAQMYRSQGELTQGQYQGIAQLALTEGDTGEFNAAMLQSSTANRNNDAQYQGAAKRLEADKKQPSFRGAALVQQSVADEVDGRTRRPGRGLYAGAQKQMEDRKAALDTQNAATSQQYTSEFASLNQNRQTLVNAGLNIRTGQAEFATAQAQGASAASLPSTLTGSSSGSSPAAAGGASAGVTTASGGAQFYSETYSPKTGLVMTPEGTSPSAAASSPVARRSCPSVPAASSRRWMRLRRLMPLPSRPTRS